MENFTSGRFISSQPNHYFISRNCDTSFASFLILMLCLLLNLDSHNVPQLSSPPLYYYNMNEIQEVVYLAQGIFWSFCMLKIAISSFLSSFSLLQFFLSLLLSDKCCFLFFPCFYFHHGLLPTFAFLLWLLNLENWTFISLWLVW